MQFPVINIYNINTIRDKYDFPKALTKCKIGKGDNKYNLLDLFCGFDIETTTITTPDGHHLSFAYHFQLSIGNPRGLNVFLFRKWEVVLDFIEKMADHYKLGAKTHMIIAIANMGFEFQFLRKRLHWDEGSWDFFAKEKYEPLRATYRGIEFREVLSITGGSLAQLAKDYCTTQKLVTIDEHGNKVSDLDYKKLRNSQTPMTELEKQYCINDVVILSEFMWYLFCNFIWPEHYIPMTFTGILHREFKEELRQLCLKRDVKYGLPHGTSLDTWKDFIKTLQPTQANYELFFKYLFRGGYVHANAAYVGVDGLKAHMRDITSHYPARMNLDYFPMSRFKEIDLTAYKTYKEQLAAVNKYCKNKCVIIHAQFDYIRTTTTHTIESKSKIVNYSNAKWDNGRLICADCVDVWLTGDKDLEVYKMFYRWEGMTILSCLVADRGKLPPYVLSVLNRHYQKKEALKRAGLNDTMEYTIEKSRANTCYGDLVKRIRLERVLYDNTNEWHADETPVDYEKEIAKAILSPFWGIWVCSAGRLEICRLLFKLTKAGVPCYYGDTDSLKYKPCHKAEQIFKRYNASIRRHRKNRKLRSEFFDGLGEFDKEGWIKDEEGNKKEWAVVGFKTLGSKRYIYTLQGKVYATVAGMPKASVYQLGKTPEEVIKAFKMTGYKLTPEESGKLTTQYTDVPYSYNIDGEVMTELSGVALYEIPFTLNTKTEYLQHVTQLQYELEREEALL